MAIDSRRRHTEPTALGSDPARRNILIQPEEVLGIVVRLDGDHALPSLVICLWHTGLFVAAWSLIGDAAETYDLTNIGTLFAFMLVSIGVLVLRYLEPDRPRPFRVPFVWPVCVLSALGFVFIMWGLPGTAWVRFAGWLVIGLIVYFTYGFTHSKLRAAARR